MAKAKRKREELATKGTKSTAKKKSKQTRTTQGVAKPAQPKGKTALKAARKVADNTKRAAGRPSKELTEKSAMNRIGVQGFAAMNDKSPRKSQRIDAPPTPSTDPNPAEVIEVPRPKARFLSKDTRENVAIISADFGNWTTIVGWALGLHKPETFDLWQGATVQRTKEIRTRGVARWSDDDEKWHLEFGPETNVVCEEEGRVIVFDNMKHSMNPASIHFQPRLEKQKKIGIKNIYKEYIQYVFLTVFNAAKLANPKIDYFRVYTALPPEWPEDPSFEFQETIENIQGWKGRVYVNIPSETSAAVTGRLKSLPVQQRKDLGVYLEDREHAGVLDLGDATAVSHLTRVLSSRC